MRKSSAATADSATKLSADEPGEAEHVLTFLKNSDEVSTVLVSSEILKENKYESISAKTGHLNRDHSLGRGAPFISPRCTQYAVRSSNFLIATFGLSGVYIQCCLLTLPKTLR